MKGLNEHSRFLKNQQRDGQAELVKPIEKRLTTPIDKYRQTLEERRQHTEAHVISREAHRQPCKVIDKDGNVRIISPIEQLEAKQAFFKARRMRMKGKK